MLLALQHTDGALAIEIAGAEAPWVEARSGRRRDRDVSASSSVRAYIWACQSRAKSSRSSSNSIAGGESRRTWGPANEYYVGLPHRLLP